MRSKLGKLVEESRDKAQLTQEELARALQARGVPVVRETISRIEQGRVQRPDPNIVNALAAVLPVTVAELCRAMGYDIPEQGEILSAEETEAVRLLRRTVPQARPVILGTMRELVRQLQEPTVRELLLLTQGSRRLGG